MGVLKCAKCEQFAIGNSQKDAAPKIDHAASSTKCPANPDHLTWHEDAIVENGKIILANIPTPRAAEKSEAVTVKRK